MDVVAPVLLTRLSATVLRDTLYLDGGILWWQPGYANGTVGQPLYDREFPRHQ